MAVLVTFRLELILLPISSFILSCNENQAGLDVDSE
jgi:hypothetical protein